MVYKKPGNGEPKIRDEIYRIIARKAQLELRQVEPNQSFRDTLGFDEIDFLDLLVDIEDKYGFRTPESDVGKIKTVDDMVNYVRRIKGK